MKKIFLLVMCLFLMLMPSLGMAEDPLFGEDAGFFDWAGMGTMAGAVAAVLIIVQYIKAPLDKVWKIPTRVVVYVIAFMLLMAADIVAGAVSWERTVLVLLNAFLVATSAMGAYEMTFKKTETWQEEPPDLT